ncbi:helix-turn-helix domain-containing protein [Aquibacillus halophilus]|uniref:Helix-turn-helix domain-containing protein n=2 Tax=Aquibacillus halophilus TaxID=930132 RepID=A0A6A8DEF6_9BACI|nr:helix-turn-helix domain-containing protein [Aquibacillus halophilus]
MEDQFIAMRIKNRQNEYLHPSFLLESRLLEATTHGDQKEALTIIQSINKDQRPHLASIEIRSLKNSLICSCTLFTRAIIRGGVHPETAFTLSDTYILEIERQDDIVLLDKLEYQMLCHFIDVLNNEEKLPYGKTINRAITYIHDHILEDLNLHVIGKHCFVNHSYLSHLFKKEVGYSIVHYINKKRVEEAKYLLLHTTSSISEIAMLFKFCNQSYFTAQFKQFEGLTPRQFRDKHLS